MKRLITLSMALVFLFSSFAVNAAYYEEILVPVEVINSDLEKPVIVDKSADTSDEYGAKKSDQIEGWSYRPGFSDTPTLPGDLKFTLEKDPKNPNNNVLMIIDTRKTGTQNQIGIWSDPIAVSEGDKVVVDMDIYLKYASIGVGDDGNMMNSRQLNIKAHFFKSDGSANGNSGSYIAHSSVTTTYRDTWVTRNFIFDKIPAGTASMRIDITTDSANYGALAYIDNLKVNMKNSKSISDPIIDPSSIIPGGDVTLSLDIENGSKDAFPVQVIYGLYNSHNEIVEVKTFDNASLENGTGTITSTMKMPEDISGNKIYIMILNISNGRIVPYYKWVSVTN